VIAYQYRGTDAATAADDDDDGEQRRDDELVTNERDRASIIIRDMNDWGSRQSRLISDERV